MRLEGRKWWPKSTLLGVLQNGWKFLWIFSGNIENKQRFIPDGLEWNGKEEGFFVEWLSYFVLFTDRFSFAIVGSHPHFILSTLKNHRPKTAKLYIRISFEYLLELQSDSLIYKSLQFISFENLLELQSDSLIIYKLYQFISFKYLLELQSDSLIYFFWISFRITIGFVNLFPLNIF